MTYGVGNDDDEMSVLFDLHDLLVGVTVCCLCTTTVTTITTLTEATTRRHTLYLAVLYRDSTDLSRLAQLVEKNVMATDNHLSIHQRRHNPSTSLWGR